ncbi:hypothetical protein CP973_23580 [Streptomyces albofaciens JCM 4342]|uniref:hypothetical protein n=1 Tax=Streptomyces albofaciens TaxID=66866 RepID=UPI00123A71B2|nr:hypothetical protein [Streptomyces albofaciens]KAA6212390.1 hypothetical protein CP973_23580 [Streptomyces albofaciens JCM 4342]
MAADRRAANDDLRALLSAAGWTYEALARNVNALGAENGMRLRYDRTSVAHWLAGSVPRPRTRALIAEAFARKLRRPVPLGALGMGKSAAPDVLDSVDVYGRKGADGETRAVTLLAVLCGMDADPVRRCLVQESVYIAAEIDADTTGWPGRSAGSSAAERPSSRESPGRPGGAAGLRSATDFFRRAGDFGGRHARSALVSYLHDDVVPRLHAGGHASTYLPLLAEAARLVHVLAGMYVDDVRNGAAQRYHRAALLLAAEAGDRTTYAVVLRSMSGHALDLGHRRPALRLSEAALAIAAADAPPEVRAPLLAQLALAQAAVGDRRRALASLAKMARQQHEMPDPRTSERCVPGSSEAALTCRKGRTLALLGDRAAAIAALRASLEQRSATAYLPCALTRAEIARLLLADGRLEEACATWHRFLDDYLHLRSGRADRILADLRGELRVHATRQPARSLLRRMDAVMRNAG